MHTCVRSWGWFVRVTSLKDVGTLWRNHKSRCDALRLGLAGPSAERFISDGETCRELWLSFLGYWTPAISITFHIPGLPHSSPSCHSKPRQWWKALCRTWILALFWLTKWPGIKTFQFSPFPWDSYTIFNWRLTLPKTELAPSIASGTKQLSWQKMIWVAVQNLKRFQLLAPLACNAEANICSDNLHKVVTELFWKHFMMVHLTPSRVTATAINTNTVGFDLWTRG